MTISAEIRKKSSLQTLGQLYRHRRRRRAEVVPRHPRYHRHYHPQLSLQCMFSQERKVH